MQERQWGAFNFLTTSLQSSHPANCIQPCMGLWHQAFVWPFAFLSLMLTAYAIICRTSRELIRVAWKATRNMMAQSATTYRKHSHPSTVQYFCHMSSIETAHYHQLNSHQTMTYKLIKIISNCWKLKCSINKISILLRKQHDISQNQHLPLGPRWCQRNCPAPRFLEEPRPSAAPWRRWGAPHRAAPNESRATPWHGET